MPNMPIVLGMSIPDITYNNFDFKITATDDKSMARCGEIVTPHGIVETPNYIVCGTKAAVKAASPRQVKEVGTQIILANTYHMMIQPGADLVEQMGGLHKFTGWDGPMLTDSGGYQIFAMQHGSVAKDTGGQSLSTKEKSLLKITEEGAYFRSYKGGQKLLLSPEISIQVQRKLGADLIVQLDECTAYKDSKSYTAEGVERSMRWGDRSLQEFAKHHDNTQAMYGVIQGAHFKDLREISIQYLKDRPFFGTAIGGSMGKGKDDLFKITRWCTEIAPEGRPIHLLGYAHILDIFEGVKLGVDTFDCVHPTRLARHGHALVKGHSAERININNAKYKNDDRPIMADLKCYTSEFSRAYIHHLFKAGELLGMQLLTQHNIAAMQTLLSDVRRCIKEGGDLDALQAEWLPAEPIFE